MVQRFEMPWDRTLRITTGFFVLLLLGVGLGVPAVAWRAAGGEPSVLPALALPLLAVVVTLPLAWALAPRALAVGGGEVRVERPLRPVVIPLAALRAVGRLPREAEGGLLRTFGSGGAFGYYGRYWSRRLGAVRLHATRLRDFVVLEADDGRHLVTPGDPEAFVAAVLRAAPRARPLTTLEGLQGASPTRGAWKLVLGTLAAVAALVAGVLVVVSAWAPVAVRVEGDVVVVARRWMAPVAVPLPAGHGAVRPLTREELRGYHKVSGANLGDARWGRYATTALGPFQLYAPRSGPHWLLRTADGPVVVVPDDGEALERWARAHAGAPAE
jgi:hypothetical protein